VETLHFVQGDINILFSKLGPPSAQTMVCADPLYGINPGYQDTILVL